MSEIVKCIFCLMERKGTVEHIFPDSLGGLLTIDEVCKSCNDQLGSKVDQALVNHELMQLARFTKKIKGKTGKIPNPIGVGRLKDGGDIVHNRVNKNGDPDSLYIVPRQVEEDDGKTLKFSVDVTDKKKLPQMVNKALLRRGKQAMSEEEIFSKIQNGIVDQPEITIEMSFDLILYKKALAKIIYEMTFFWLGEKYLIDPIGGELRQYLLSDKIKVDTLIGGADLVDVSDKNGMAAMFGDKDTHFSILVIDGNKIICYVNVFNQFEAKLLVSENAQEYEILESMYFENNTKKKCMGNSTLTQEIIRRSQIIK
ncbi:HNH endonuclease [uncultured Psychrobacillus sp.]|uniref:HNH endonuclease n=3 Tax=Psychrobacillus TaxID=1221880 RepID=UPI00261CF3D5|nr:HNH endonuclease [uncultured Psychrobacillus sp.]